MPWKECHVEDERLRLGGPADGGTRHVAPLCGIRDLAEDRLQDL
jgi:hypothetical protein